jgi:hypothetical protein
MNGVRQKPARIQFDPMLPDQLRNQVLRRDGWRCQSCGAMSNLEVHHKEFRSRSGMIQTRTDYSVRHLPRQSASPHRRTRAREIRRGSLLLGHQLLGGTVTLGGAVAETLPTIRGWAVLGQPAPLCRGEVQSDIGVVG